MTAPAAFDARSPAGKLLASFSVASVCIVLLASCATSPMRPAVMPWQDSQQAIVVLVADWDSTHGVLHTYERSGADWQQKSAAHEVMVGRNGSAWGIGMHPVSDAGPLKQEGDGRSPAGVFAIGPAFGYADAFDTGLQYDAMRATHYCMDVPASPFYNRILDSDLVGTAAVAGSTEPMRLDLHAQGDPRYRLGFSIEHNPQNKPGAGSCIFAHLRRSPGEATAGCTSMDEPRMQALLGWLAAERHPIFVLMPEAEYSRLQPQWQLPPVGSAR